MAPIVPAEAVGDRWADAHRQSLHDMQQKYGDVLPVDDVVTALRDLSGVVAPRA